ncbi:thioredoxin family protein [Bremerella sp. JC817]|uniref:thioredoxin family protein n=1 Tax=Bremerella sp. JC817 TaxID=3231756 RepID=UPI003458F69A
MPFDCEYREVVPSRQEIDQSQGRLVIEFGQNWCEHCQKLSDTVQALLTEHPEINHIRVADGRGKRLGRTFRVKLWPTFVFLLDGELVAQLVRPTEEQAKQGFVDYLAEPID